VMAIRQSCDPSSTSTSRSVHDRASSLLPTDYFQQDDRRGSDGRSPRSHNQDYSPPSRSPSRSLSPHSHSPSRSRSRSPSRTPSPRRQSSSDSKAWYKKKTFWATVGTIAAVAALVPASVSASASTTSAKASQDAAAASKKAARASKRSANAVEASANAVVNSTIAQGHQDIYGRYTGPGRVKGGSSGGRGVPIGRPMLEYGRGRGERRRW
jgi:hypothetical protein